jgi:NADH:ubiquinone oxidoreductase subunit 6 (subunit J)
MFFDIFSLVVIVIVAAVIVWLVVIVGTLPGKIARERQHPQVEAINVLAWIGLVTLGMGWFIALVWAYWQQPTDARSSEDLEIRVATLEQDLAMLRSKEATE